VNQSIQQRTQKKQRSLAERGRQGEILEGISEDGPNETLLEQSQSDQDNDMKMLEKLFKKV